VSSLTLRDRLGVAGDRFVVTTELVPPRGADPDACLRDAAALAAFADAINVTDGAGAGIRMAALAAAALVARAGGAPILQMTCRDRNRIALAADAIGAASLGAVAVLPVYGDPVTTGAHGDAKEVRDVEPAGLVRLVADLQRGVLPGGATLAAPPRLAVGTAATPGPAPITGLRTKIEAGASFVQTQIVLDVGRFRAWLDRVRRDDVTAAAMIIPSVAVPSSERVALRLRQFGAAVPDRVVARAARGEGEAVAEEVVSALAAMPGVGGVHLIVLGTPVAVIRRLAGVARAAATA
jgi:methylenetetrahydrofolate reductase (NADPH)